MKIVDVPTKQAGLLNTDRCREAANIDHRWDDDGFWRFGYGNDPKRRRHVRHVEGATPLVNRDIVESWFRVEGI
jgi:hypothetical protein